MFKFESEEPVPLIEADEEITHQMAEGVGFNWYPSCRADHRDTLSPMSLTVYTPRPLQRRQSRIHPDPL